MPVGAVPPGGECGEEEDYFPDGISGFVRINSIILDGDKARPGTTSWPKPAMFRTLTGASLSY